MLLKPTLPDLLTMWSMKKNNRRVNKNGKVSMCYAIYIFQFDIYLYKHLKQPHYLQFSEPPKRNK